MKIVNLKTDYRTNPLGIGTSKPRFCWEMISEKRNTLQIAYRIVCALSQEDLVNKLNLHWDTGKIESDKSIQIEYDGPVLQSSQRIYWQVKIWDNHNREYEWSEVAFWEMGLLNPSDWKASWIEPDIEEDTSESNPCPFLRKEFSVNGKVHRAVVSISGRGLYQFFLNGEKVSDDLFTPGWTSYHHRIQYQAYDITDMLKNGNNAFGAILGDGWYRGFFGWQGKRNLYGDKLSFIAQILINYSDGTQDTIGSDDTWKSATGPILKSDLYNGEIYDARLEMESWNHSEFNDKDWRGVKVADQSKEILVSSESNPVRITEEIKPVKKLITPKGELVFDLGQNIVGWIQFSLKGRKGLMITLRYAEVLDKEGNFYIDNLRAAKAEDQYIFKSDEIETFEPHFTFHGFRYLKVDGYEDEIEPQNITGKIIHTDMRSTGNFECSDPLVNQLQKNIQWGLRGNFLDVPTDCPQRDERMGWTGDAQVFAPTACFNMDTAAFFTKWMNDFSVDQKKDGSVPWVVPMVVEGGGGTGWSDGYGATGWADAAIIIPWTIYQIYGDTGILEKQYNSMKAWVEYMRRESGNDHLFNTGFHFGDWLAYATTKCDYPGATTDKDLIATAYFYYSTLLLQKIAAILGKMDDADNFEKLRSEIKKAFQKEFLSQTGRLSSNTQTAYVLALAFNLIPDVLKTIAAKRLADDVIKFGHITTGFLGTPLICDVLAENGYPDLAYMLLFRKEYPSWLYPVSIGATTIWERWDGIRPDGSFQDPGMNSFNHYAYGAVGNFLYTKVAGISVDPVSPGYKKFRINPLISDKLTFAKAEYHSIHGDIKSYWQINDNKLLLDVTIPSNTTATIEFRANDLESVFEGDKPVSDVHDIKILGCSNKKIVLEAGSGTYYFKSIIR